MTYLTKTAQITFSFVLLLSFAVSGMAQDISGDYQLVDGTLVLKVKHEAHDLVTIKYQKDGISMDNHLKPMEVAYRLPSGLTVTRLEYEGPYVTRYADGSVKSGLAHLSHANNGQLKLEVYTWANNQWELESEGMLARVNPQFATPRFPPAPEWDRPNIAGRPINPRPSTPVQATQTEKEIDRELEEMLADLDF